MTHSPNRKIDLSKRDHQRISPLAAHGMLSLLTGTTTVWLFVADGGGIWLFFAGLTICELVAAVLRLGWTVPCTIMGALAGFYLDPAVKGGTQESQAWETVHYLTVGTLFGLTVGFAVDSFARSVKRE